MTISRVGDIALTWGESVRWDDKRQRLYLVDCAAQTLHWLDGGEPPLRTMQLPSLPTGVVLTEGSPLVVCLEGGLHVVDPDDGRIDMLAPYPPEMLGRANDANADGAGSLVTGTLNLGPGDGASFQFSATGGWTRLDDISNANGPVVIGDDGAQTLVIGDTPAGVLYGYDYDSESATVGPRRTFADHRTLDGVPDGATADADHGVWSCVLRSGKIARCTAAGLGPVIDMPVPHPSDVAFGGAGLDRLYVTSINVPLDGGPLPDEAAWLFVVDDLGFTGRPEPRFRL